MKRDIKEELYSEALLAESTLKRTDPDNPLSCIETMTRFWELIALLAVSEFEISEDGNDPNGDVLKGTGPAGTDRDVTGSNEDGPAGADRDEAHRDEDTPDGNELEVIDELRETAADFFDRIMGLGMPGELMLSPMDTAALSFALACQNGPVFVGRLKKLMSLSGRLEGHYDDLKMFLDLCGQFAPQDSIRPGIFISEDSFINRFFLERPSLKDSETGMYRRLRLTAGALAALYGEPYPLGICSSFMELIPPDDMGGGQLINNIDECGRAMNIFGSMLIDGGSDVLALVGMQGIGKSFIARRIASSLGRALLVIKAPGVAGYSPDELMAVALRAAAKCLFDKALVYLDMGGEKEVQGDTPLRLLSLLQEYAGVIIAGSVWPIDKEAVIRGKLYTVALSLPNKKRQEEFWELSLRKRGLMTDASVDLKGLVSTFDLDFGRIHRVCSELSALRDEALEEPLSIDEIQRGIRGVCSTEFERLATRLESSFTFDDLVLKPESMRLLKSAAARLKNRALIYEDFGFGAKLPYGQGISIAMYGPPGTGKTMAALVFANELGLDIYRVDTSRLSSKYIGETEKNLSALFEAARYSNAILFFDEADSIFTKRVEVTSSNDRHANSETAFLLQKIEEYKGVSILATNNAGNFDAAFKRRITYMIPVDMPDEETRELLWRKVYPEGTPLSEDLCFEVYSKYELTGSSIKAAAIDAAFRAAQRDGREAVVTNPDLIDAVDSEYQKLGNLNIKQKLMIETMTQNKY